MTQGGNVGKVLTLGVFDAQLSGYVFDLRWLLGLLVVLIAADFWWGTRESKQKGDELRFSRAMRKTLNKFVDYITYIIVGAFIAHVICVPIGLVENAQAGAAIGIGLGLICETDSIVKHIFTLHGLKFSWRKLLISLIKLKSPDWGQALDDAIEEKEEGK